MPTTEPDPRPDDPAFDDTNDRMDKLRSEAEGQWTVAFVEWEQITSLLDWAGSSDDRKHNYGHCAEVVAASIEAVIDGQQACIECFCCLGKMAPPGPLPSGMAIIHAAHTRPSAMVVALFCDDCWEDPDRLPRVMQVIRGARLGPGVMH